MAINIDELQIQIAVEASEAASGLKELAKGLSQMSGTTGKAAALLEQVADEISDMGTATSEAKEETEQAEKTFVSAFKRIAEAAKAAAPKIKAIGLTAGKYIGKTALVPFQMLGNGISNAVGKLTGMFSAFKRIAMYRLFRTAIKMMTQALSEGVKTLIAWDREWGNNTSYAAQTADEIVSKWGEVKKAFGAAAMPLIQILQPALMAVMQTVINVVNAINQVLRMFQGFSTYMKATAGAIETTAKAGAKAAKELQRVLFGFDELNVLPSPNNSGSGSADASAGQFDYVETAIDLPFKIDTSGKTLGAQLAELLNNVIGEFDAVEFGRKISEKINGVISNIGDFLSTFDFSGLGKKIGELFTSSLDTINWSGLGSTLVSLPLGLFDLLFSAIGNINFSSLGTAIKNFLIGALDRATSWFQETDWVQIGKNITNGLSDLIESLDVVQVAKTLGKFLWEVVKAAFQLLWGLLKGDEKDYNLNPTSSWSDKSTFEIGGNGLTNPSEINKERKWLNDTFGLELPMIDDTQYKKSYKGTQTWLNKNPLTPKTGVPYVDGAQVETDTNNLQDFLNRNPLNPFVKKPTVSDSQVKTDVTSLNDWLSNGSNHLNPITNTPSVNTSKVKQDINDQQTWNNTHPLTVATTVTGIPTSTIGNIVNNAQQEANKRGISLSSYLQTLNPQAITNFFTDAQREANKKGIGFATYLRTIGLPDAVANLLDIIQTTLNNNPLAATLKVIGTATGTQGYINKNLAKAQMAALDQMMYASGGVPDIGTLFYAGEAGAEIVANGRSGGTGVMNVAQMQEAVASGNVEVVNALYAVASMLGNEIRAKDNNVYLDGERIGQSVSRYQNNQARRGLQGAY